MIHRLIRHNLKQGISYNFDDSNYVLLRGRVIQRVQWYFWYDVRGFIYTIAKTQGFLTNQNCGACGRGVRISIPIIFKGQWVAIANTVGRVWGGVKISISFYIRDNGLQLPKLWDVWERGGENINIILYKGQWVSLSNTF